MLTQMGGKSQGVSLPDKDLQVTIAGRGKTSLLQGQAPT